MSECVVRMEMPKSCKNCHFRFQMYCGFGKDISPEYILLENRPYWCPILCQLPEWHGRLIDADALMPNAEYKGKNDFVSARDIANAPTVPALRWHRVEDGLPKEAGEYIVAYHPCWWNDVNTSVTEIGIDTFRGKTSWAKKKFQRVTHWMEKPEPPQEEQWK